MFTDKFQGRLVSVYHSVGSRPLADWLVRSKEGDDLRTVKDEGLKSNVLQILSPNVIACSITTPVDPRGSLNVRLPCLTLQLKNLDRYFTFEVTVLDAENIRRRFRASNFLSASRTSVFSSSVPLPLDHGWNQVQFNLAEFTERTFGTSYVETVRVSVHANCRLRRVYFSDRLYTNDQLPEAFHLYRTAKPRDRPARFAVAVPVKSASKKTATKPAEEAAKVTVVTAEEAVRVTTEEAAEVTMMTAEEAAKVTAEEATAEGMTTVATGAPSDEHDN